MNFLTLQPTQNNLAYKTMTKSNENHVVWKHQYYLQKWGFTLYSKLPTKSINSKFHKTQPGMRPIIAAPAVTTTNLEKLLTILLMAAIDNLR